MIGSLRASTVVFALERAILAIRQFSLAWTTVAVRRHVRRALVLLVLNLSATFAVALGTTHSGSKPYRVWAGGKLIIGAEQTGI